MARSKSVRSNFSSGVMDPLLADRTDIPQYRAGLRTGTNVMLLPHGGFMRRPGCRFCRELTGLGSTPGRISRFRFNLEQSYLLHWRDDRLDVYQPTTQDGGLSDAERITRIRTPYGDEHIPDLNFRAQTADTQVIFHQSVAPHRLLRAALRATNPVRTFTSTTVRIYHPNHKLLTGDEIGLSGLEATGGVSAASLNSFYAVTTYGGNFSAGDVDTTATSADVVITVPAGHAFTTDDYIKLSGLAAIGGITAAQLNRTHRITGTAATTVTITLPIAALSTASNGAVGSWVAANFYHITVGSAATSSTTGGGTAGRAWVLHSLAPNANRDAALVRLPQFDFEDESSPSPKNELQRITFDDFIAGDWYILELSAPNARGRSASNSQTSKIDWSADNIEDNATRIQIEFNAILAASFVTATVTYDLARSAGNGGSGADHHEFTVEFTPPIAIPLIQVFKVSQDAGAIDISRDVVGGSTEEDVISTTRGWPRGGLFYQGRLFMYGLASRPATILASKSNDLFDFDVGSATDSDAIDATGSFDPILDMIDERGLFALTSASEIEISGGDSGGITPGNITLRVASRYGTSGVPAVSVAGRPIYVDRTGRTVRQLGFVDTSGAVESKDISILSQFLIGDPVAMDVWRNEYGDYAAVCMEDGSLVVLNINVDQAVAGWTKWTTDGDFVDVCESGDVLYVIVSRNINGTDKYFLEAFDFDYHTDAAALVLAPLGDADGVWSGFSHLTGETVQVRQDAQTMASVVVSAGTVTAKMGDVTVTGGVSLQAGLAIPTPTAEPMPGSTSEFMSVTHVRVDLYRSRGVFVDGYRLDEATLGESLTGTPLVTGWREMNLMGWGDRDTVAITAPEPQPMTVRAVEMEVALAA